MKEAAKIVAALIVCVGALWWVASIFWKNAARSGPPPRVEAHMQQTSPTGPYHDEVSALTGLFGNGRTTAADRSLGLGPLWGNYAENETVKVWVNGTPDGRSVENVKLSVLVPLGGTPSATAKSRAKMLLARYAPSATGYDLTSCAAIPAGDAWGVEVRCNTGPKLKETILIFTPKVTQ